MAGITADRFSVYMSFLRYVSSNITEETWFVSGCAVKVSGGKNSEW